ncbi:type I restriction enzyme, S subunit [Prevotellaceae bacterium MN60]|nr:type I restriction enzyme, S subunit [Prevotellaceae bacterium MN60]
MTAQQLKNAILQEAIQGRLVPQDPNDEPASVLLDRIRKEKQQLVKEGKLKKKDLEEKQISEDEIPFEIPESWEWCKLGWIGSWGAGATPAKGNSEFYDNGTIPWLRTGELNNGYVYDSEIKVTEKALEKCSLRMCQKGDVLIAMYGATIGKVAIAGIELTTNQACCACTPYIIYNKYLLYYLLVCKKTFTEMGEGGAQPNISREKIIAFPFALPPLAEQKRIVEKIEELMPKVEEYGKAQEKLNKLNEELPEKLKKSILQEAIEGRLVPQDPNDEPASALLQRIRAEKERLVKEGKLKKKDLIETPIAEDEIPFEIPESWRWERLGELVSNQTGLSYSKGDLEKRVNSPIRVLRGGNIQNGSWCTKVDDVMIAPEYIKKPNLTLQKNTFITPAVTSLEHLGKTALIEEDHSDIVAGGFVLYLLPFYRNDIFSKYLLYYFQSAYYNTYCQSIANKSGQAFWNLSRQKLMNLVLPIPPLAEQHRIVEKLEQVLGEIDKLKK